VDGLLPLSRLSELTCDVTDDLVGAPASPPWLTAKVDGLSSSSAFRQQAVKTPEF